MVESGSGKIGNLVILRLVAVVTLVIVSFDTDLCLLKHLNSHPAVTMEIGAVQQLVWPIW